MPAQTSLSFKRVLLEFVLPFLGLAAICLVNSFIVHKVFSVSSWRYLQWFVEAGPFIGLALTAFGAAWDALDSNLGLVSTNPRSYIIACTKLAGLPIFAFGGHLKSDNNNGINLWDVLVAVPLILLFVVASFAWLLLIAPLQYFLFLVCAAPSRIALRSRYRLYARVEGKMLNYAELKPGQEKPPFSWDASMRSKPVTMANAFGVAVLFIVGYFISG